MIHCLKGYLNPVVIKDIDQHLKRATLKENSRVNGRPVGTDKIIITGLDEETIVIKIDQYKTLSQYLTTKKRNATKRCDYLVVTKSESGDIMLLFCELKSGTIAGAEKQLKLSGLFLDYLISIINFLETDEIKNIKKTYSVITKTDSFARFSTGTTAQGQSSTVKIEKKNDVKHIKVGANMLHVSNLY